MLHIRTMVDEINSLVYELLKALYYKDYSNACSDI